MTIINSYKTLSFCYKCQRPVDAEISYRSDNKVYLKHFCNCVNNEFVVENDYAFWDGLLTALTKNKEYHAIQDTNNNTVIDITSRCNLHCKHCYYVPNNSIPDKPIEEIIKFVKMVKTDDIVLVGAEPTMRKDLFELINKASEFKNIAIQTNAQKLANMNYVKELKKSKLMQVDISINSDSYHENIEIYNNAITGLWNVIKNDIKIGNLSFIITSQKDAQKAVDFIISFEKKFNLYKKIFNFKNSISQLRYTMYSPIKAGRFIKEDPDIFISDLFNMFQSALDNRGIKIKKEDIFNGINTPYDVILNTPFSGSIHLYAYTTAARGFDLNITTEYYKGRPDYLVGNGYINFIAHAIALEKYSPNFLNSL